MAFDGITVAGLCSELQDTIGGGRIYKIAQTDKNELVITVRPSAPSFRVIALETYVPAPSRNRSAPEESNREFPEPSQSPASPVR